MIECLCVFELEGLMYVFVEKFEEWEGTWILELKVGIRVSLVAEDQSFLVKVDNESLCVGK